MQMELNNIKLIYLFLAIFCITAFKNKDRKQDVKSIDKLAELKKDVGLPPSFTDTLSLISLISSDEFDYDKKFLKIDYKEKMDSLYKVMDEELNIIGFEDHFKDDARSGLNQLKQSYILDQSAAEFMWSASYGTNYREYRLDKNAFKRIEQMIYKRRYEELLIYNYHLRINLTRSIVNPYTESYRKRLKDVMPKKVLDSMYPKKEK